MNTVMVWAAFLCWFLMSMFTAFLATVAFQARSDCGSYGIQRDSLCSFD